MGPQGPVVEELAKAYSFQHPEIKVIAEFKGSYDETFLKTITAAKAGNPPHVVQVVVSSTRAAIDSNLFVPIEDVFDQYGISVNWEDFIDAPMNMYRIGGRLYSIPWNSSSPITFWNKSIFDKAGLSLSKKPYFSEVTEAARKIVGAGLTKSGITWALVKFFFENWMSNMDQNLVDAENGRIGRPAKAYFLSDAATRSYGWFKQLWDEGFYESPGRRAWGEAKRLFGAQVVPMALHSTAGTIAYEQTAVGKFEVSSSYLPVPDGTERQGVMVGGASLWMTKGHPDAEMETAARLAVWMTDMAQTIRWHQSTGYYPIKRDAMKILEREGWYVEHPNHRTALEQLMETKPSRATQGAVVGAYREIHDIIIWVYEAIMEGTSVEEALAEADKRAKDAITEYRRSVE